MQLITSVPERIALKSTLITYQKNTLYAKPSTQLLTNLTNFKYKK